MKQNIDLSKLDLNEKGEIESQYVTAIIYLKSLSNSLTKDPELAHKCYETSIKLEKLRGNRHLDLLGSPAINTKLYEIAANSLTDLIHADASNVSLVIDSLYSDLTTALSSKDSFKQNLSFTTVPPSLFRKEKNIYFTNNER